MPFSLAYVDRELRSLTAMRKFYIHLHLLLALCTSISAAAADIVRAPNSEATAIDQMDIDKNGCGPVSQLNAYAFSSAKWRKTTDKIPGNTQLERFEYLIKKHGGKLSRHIQGRIRWDKRRGMNCLDLLDYINDFHAQAKLPKIKLESFFLEGDEDHSDLLKRTHATLKKSMEQGLPPIIDLRRFAKTRMAGGYMWRGVHGHFVVVYEIPSTLPDNATSMTIKYIDSWGGAIRTGTLVTPSGNFFANDTTQRSGYKLRRTPCLEANFPGCNVGSHLLKPGEENVLILSAALGDF